VKRHGTVQLNFTDHFSDKIFYQKIDFSA